MGNDSPTEFTSSSISEPTHVDLTGRLVADDFQVLRRLGGGGMGQVYLAEQKSLERKVALKILRADLASDEKALERFAVEAKTVAKATHPNIVQVYAFGEWQGVRYVALEYVEGSNLREHLEKKGPPDLLLTLSIVRQVASALQRAAELGITHRDIKPENVLLTRKREVKVTDFGLVSDAKQQLNLTQSGVTMGTPLYMSPEQVEGRPIDPRSDIYSLGVTCYYLLAGAPPFDGKSAFEVALKHVREEPAKLQLVRPDLPDELSAIVHKMMEKEPADRYQTARELLVDLEQLRSTIKGQTNYLPLASDSPSTTAVQSPARKRDTARELSTPSQTEVLPTKKRRSGLVLVVASLLFSLLGGGALAYYLHRDQREQGPVAPIVPRTTVEKREKELRAQVDGYLAGGEGYTNVGSGIGQCIELALLHFEERDHDKAWNLFLDMELAGERAQPRSEMRDYAALGMLGQAIVLSKQGAHQRSKKHFEELLQDESAAERRFALPRSLRTSLQNRTLQWHCRKALDANRDAGQALSQIPDWLNRYLRGPAAPPKTRPPGTPDRNPK